MQNPSIKELQEQLAHVNLQIAAIQEKERAESISIVRALVQRFQLKPYEIFNPLNSTPTKETRNAPAKFRDPETGATWSGRGITPLWIRGKNKAAFLIR